jgi:hypothetical protein
MAKIITKYEFAGSGCLVQGIGLILLVFWPIGTIAGAGLLIYGSIMSKRLLCGNCKNRLESKHVTICPVCKETVQ